MIESFFVINLF